MVFGSRRITLRNRRFLRKFKPVFPADTVTTPLSADTNSQCPASTQKPRPVATRQPSTPPAQLPAQQLIPATPQQQGTSPAGQPTATTYQGQPPSYNPLQIQNQDHLYQSAQGPCHLQSPVRAAPLPDIPINTQCTTFQPTTEDNLTPPPTSVNDMVVYTPHPSYTAVQPSLPESDTPRRSSRCTKGMTDRYKDFVQSLDPQYQHHYPMTNQPIPMPSPAILYHHQPYQYQDHHPQPSHLQSYNPLPYQGTPTPAYLHLPYFPTSPVAQYHSPTPRQTPSFNDATCQQIGIIMVPQLSSDFRNSPEPYQSQQGGWA
jgi:hypothetical protein